MAYDNSSLTGDEICDYHYDIENNFMNPPSPTGFFIYKVIGGAFDWLGDLITQFRIDYSILDCNVGDVEIVNGFPEEPNTNHTYYVTNYTTTGGSFTKYSFVDGEWVSETVTGDVLNSLDVFWGRSYNLVRPHLSYVSDGATYTRVLSDEEYRIYLYLKNHQLLTMKDLLVSFGNAFGSAETSTTILGSIHTVDHKRYDTPPFTNVTLAAYDEDDTDIITDNLVDKSGVNVVNDRLAQGTISIIVPDNDWDEQFLRFLESFISIKGNILISVGD